MTLTSFIDTAFLPFHRKHWKRLTDASRTDSIQRHIVGEIGRREIASITRDDLQAFLDARKHLSYAFVNHLRWDLKQILDLAVADGVIQRNPIYSGGKMFLFVPKECSKPERQAMSIEEARLAFTVLELRERLVVKLGILAGMRCSEIFGLRRGAVHGAHANIVERVCRRDVDTPKTEKSKRQAALSANLQEDMRAWLATMPEDPDGWLFPSENPRKPIDSTNLLMRAIRPRLSMVGLEWVDFRVLRRTHATLMRAQGIDPKTVADQQGHGIDVNLNCYTQTSLESRLAAVDKLGEAMVNL